MKSRIIVLMIALMSVTLLFGCATSGKLDPNSVRTDDLNFWEEAGWADLTMADIVVDSLAELSAGDFVKLLAK